MTKVETNVQVENTVENNKPKRMMILLHGFKRNNEDDFGRVHHFFKRYEDDFEIKNVIWYDNYNKKTLNKKYLDILLSQVALDINLENPDDIVIVAYSTGNVVAMYLIDKIKNKDKVRFFGTVPPFDIEKFKWIDRLKEQSRYKKSLRKKLGLKRYLRVQKIMKKNKQTEKYPLQIINYVFTKIIKPDGFRVGEIENGHFLLALDDQVVSTPTAYRELKKHKSNDITIVDFKHDQLFKLDQEVFIEWFSEKFKY